MKYQVEFKATTELPIVLISIEEDQTAKTLIEHILNQDYVEIRNEDGTVIVVRASDISTCILTPSRLMKLEWSLSIPEKKEIPPRPKARVFSGDTD